MRPFSPDQLSLRFGFREFHVAQLREKPEQLLPLTLVFDVGYKESGQLLVSLGRKQTMYVAGAIAKQPLYNGLALRLTRTVPKLELKLWHRTPFKPAPVAG